MIMTIDELLTRKDIRTCAISRMCEMLQADDDHHSVPRASTGVAVIAISCEMLRPIACGSAAQQRTMPQTQCTESSGSVIHMPALD